MAEVTQEGGAASQSPETETKARTMGWVPKTEWRGPEAAWIDANEFVQRGEQMIPYIKSENRRLHETVEQQNLRLAKQDADLKDLQASIETLKNFNNEISEERVKTLRKQIAAEIKQAREDGNVERELELNDQLGAATEALNEAKAAPKRKEGSGTSGIPGTSGTSTTPPIDPEWLSQNSWFGKDDLRSDLAMTVGQRIRAQHPNLVGRAFLNKVSEEVLRAMPILNENREAPSRVEGGSNGAGGGGAGNQQKAQKTYADLPSDAKAVCDRYAKQLVSANGPYKTVEEFRKHYVSQYDFS